jgi:hypothetical protein
MMCLDFPNCSPFERYKGLKSLGGVGQMGGVKAKK